MYISWADWQVGISAGAMGAKTPRIGRIEKSEVFRLRMLLEKSQEQVIQLALQLREADHRIKNSLQIAASVMQFDARRAESDTLRDALITSASRIQAISVIHEALQADVGDSLVDIHNLMDLMCTSMQDLCDGKAGLHFHADGVSLEVPVAFARALMLVVNELIVNALRHAFPPDTPGTISVRIEHVKDGIRIVVEDDGVGIATVESGQAGFGAELIAMMTRQIGGKLVSDRVSGTRFTLTAPLPSGPDTSDVVPPVATRVPAPTQESEP